MTASDLVDYLRDKLEHAHDAVCTCGRVYVGWDNPPKTARGRRNPSCPEHRRPGEYAAAVWRANP